MSKAGISSIPPDYTWPGFELLPEPLKICHRRFFETLAQRNPVTLREYRRAFLALYGFMQEQGLAGISDLTPKRLETFQHWCYRRNHWSEGNVQALLERTLRRIGEILKRLGLLKDNPFVYVSLVTPQRQEAAQPLSWFHALRAFLRWSKKRGLNHQTQWAYLHALRHFRRFLKETNPCLPAQITPERLDQFGTFLAVRPVRAKRPLTPGMQQVVLQRVRSFARWLEREGFLRQGATVQSGVPSQGDAPPAEGTSRLRRVADEFLAHVRMRYVPETYPQYLRNLHRFMEWIAARPPGKGVRDMDDLTVEVLTEYLRWLNAEARQPDGSPLTQPQKEGRLYPLKAFLEFCHRKGFLPQDLRRFILVPRREHKALKRLLSEEEMSRLLETPEETSTLGIRDRALLELAYSGLRAGELLGLEVEDVDLEENRVFIRQGKGNKDRVVPMTSAARYWLSRWLSRRKEFLPEGDSAKLFLTPRRRPLSRRQFAKDLERYAQHAQLPVSLSPHDLRRITATHLAAHGAPIRYIQALLGHESLKVTTKYVRLSDDQIRVEYDRTHPSSRRSRHLVPIA